jgi:hypothetical protein
VFTLLTLDIDESSSLVVTSEETDQLSEMLSWITVIYRHKNDETIVYDDLMCEFFQNLYGILSSALSGRIESSFPPASLGLMSVLYEHGLLERLSVIKDYLGTRYMWSNREAINAATWVTTIGNQLVFEVTTEFTDILSRDDFIKAERWLEIINSFKVKASFSLSNDQAKQWLAKSEEIIRSWGTGELDID